MTETVITSASDTSRDVVLLPSLRVMNEPLTYRRDTPFSFFQDLLASQLRRGDIAAAETRLDRHVAEMRTVAETREKQARLSTSHAGYEYRVEPNRTDGTGGYFSPPAWLNDLFATGKHAERVLAALIEARFPLPQGVSQINTPVISTPNIAQPMADNSGVPGQSFTDTSASSTVVEIAGKGDVALQLLEQSPAGAHLDYVTYKDLREAYDNQLEYQLLEGVGSGSNQLTGIAQVAGINTVTYTDASPTGSHLWPLLAEGSAQLSDARKKPPQVWLMRNARWAWILGAEDSANRPFGLAPVYMGDTPDTPDPLGGLFGYPVFADESIPATQGTTLNQDSIILCRPSDLVLFEGAPQTAVMREPGSGNLSVRLTYRNYCAALTSRYPSGISVVSGSGAAVQSGY